MADIHQRLADLGTAVPEILLPKPGVDLEKWAVIACDQFTQNRAYWEDAAAYVGDAPSTLSMIFPEVYLPEDGREERIRRIHAAMDRKLREGFFAPPRRACVYVERATPFHPCRRGLVLAVDLEQYDWKAESRLLIRSTEGTLPERLPPRIAIRRGASLEIPHILLLINDEEDRLLSGLSGRARRKSPAYDTPLMMQSGHIKGWLLEEEEDWAFLAQGLEALAQQGQGQEQLLQFQPQAPDTRPFLYAVGDGNHSLATAKAVWENYKREHREPDLMNHPARWALVEVENIYDPGLGFEPIHRVIFGVSPAEILQALSALPDFSKRAIGSRAELSRLIAEKGAAKNRLGLITGTECTLLESNAPGLATDSLQPLLDTLILDQKAQASEGSVSIDYIHGEEELFSLTRASTQAVGLLLPPIEKRGLFETVSRSGPLPRKSFSMGEAEEKRFYLECRRLFATGT
ncbi:MAG: DUF1015 domain-containing protein [Spirochaetaceae bacterium]|jgi:hypothetical protein|nr:DUF1015 domain-containing protein [Spirochaetaceae bacterium]